MSRKRLLLFVIPMLMYLVIRTESRFEFSNFVCTSYDKKFGEFEYCYIKAVNRSYKYISGKLKLFKFPIKKIKVNLALWKRFNGYRPFMYNVTFDACGFLVNPNSNVVVKYFHNIHRPYSNMNHSCPYNHDIILEKLPIDFVNHQVSNVLPFPEGDYLFKIKWLISNYSTASVEVYGTLS